VRALTFAVACCLVLAGCNAGPLPATAGDEVEETLTPVPVPEQGADPEELPALPPGVNATGVENVSALAAAHREALQNHSYVLRTRRNTVNRTNGSIGRRTLRLRQLTVENETVYAGQVNRLEDWPGWSYRSWNNRSVFADGHAEFTRDEELGSPTYTREPIYLDRPPSSDTARAIRQHLDEGPATVSVVQRDERRLLRIDTRDAPRNTGDSSSDRNAGTVLLVDSRGLVYRFQSHHGEELDDGRWLRYSFRFDRIGGVQVDRPAWVSAARANTSRDRYRATASGGKRQAEPCLSSGRVAFISCQSE